jgi:hypothetical protein
MAFGRPRVFENEQDMADRVEAYFEHIKGEKQQQVGKDGLMQEIWVREPEPATVTGLAIFLGFESRQSLYDYEKNGDFSFIAKKARLLVECEYEKRLTTSQAPTGAIFALKNMGWIDKNEVGFTNKDGDDTSPVQIYQLPDNKRDAKE